MNVQGLDLPNRQEKPRESGWTVLIDPGLPTGQFQDVIRSYHRLIDMVKFGWGTSLVTDQLWAKIECLQEFGLGYFFGGTLFEKYYSQGLVDRYYQLCSAHRCPFVEISDGTVVLDSREKGRFIRDFSREFRVLSEVGYKDQDRSINLHPAKWIQFIENDLDAGAEKVITEARESGTSGICRANGEIRFGLIEEIIDSGISPDRLIFEAPNKTMQIYFLRRLGPNANLANVAMADVVGLETLRLGLRSDTLLLWEMAGGGDEGARISERLSLGHSVS